MVVLCWGGKRRKLRWWREFEDEEKNIAGASLVVWLQAVAVAGAAVGSASEIVHQSAQGPSLLLGEPVHESLKELFHHRHRHRWPLRRRAGGQGGLEGEPQCLSDCLSDAVCGGLSVRAVCVCSPVYVRCIERRHPHGQLIQYNP